MEFNRTPHYVNKFCRKRKLTLGGNTSPRRDIQCHAGAQVMQVRFETSRSNILRKFNAFLQSNQSNVILFRLF